MNNKIKYLKYLNGFESILNQFGYNKTEEKNNTTKTSKEDLYIDYSNANINLKICLDYTLWDDGGILLSMSMFKIPSEKTFFSLSDFLKNNNLTGKISLKLSAGGVFEPFVAKYFQDLESLFKNELNDQITGKTFENHMDALNKSWDEHRDAAYQMELDEVSKFNKV
jgi:hypothetical protein